MKLIKFLFVIIVGLVIANVTLTNAAVDESIIVANLTDDIADLQNANTIAAAQSAAAGSLGSLTARIHEAGFVAAPTLVSVETPSPVALR
jgi:hypothetical protein